MILMSCLAISLLALVLKSTNRSTRGPGSPISLCFADFRLAGDPKRPAWGAKCGLAGRELLTFIWAEMIVGISAILTIAMWLLRSNRRARV